MSSSSRRDFLLTAAAAAAAAAALPLTGCATGGGRRPARGERLRVAQIGCGGKGFSDMQAIAKRHDVIALCDVDEAMARNARAEQPKAAFYQDYRELFDRETLDAVVVSTPDHSHAVPALIAMQLGCHVFVQKPLAHTVEEARLLRQAAKRYGVVTSMGNQGTCLDGFREAAEVVRSGAIGKVTEVHVWTNRPIWPQGIARPPHIDPIPAQLRWDLWLGAAPYRPYAGPRKDEGFSGYAPFHWRGWWDFGTGALGDMACHVANLPYFALGLGAPDWVEADAPPAAQGGGNDETAPRQSTIRFGFPARGEQPPVVLTWYDGGRRPPASLVPDPNQAGGFLLVGDKGQLYSPTDYGETFQLLPRERFAGYTPPARTLPRSPGVHDEWLDCIENGGQPMAGFDYSGPFTEAMLLGNVALRLGRRIEWDSQGLRAKNDPEADRYLKKEYRRGFELVRP
ncbi:MAG: Gfo/Idh/MocA family protein [Planctomycetota bacterium]